MRTDQESDEVSRVYNLDKETIEKYVQFGEVFNLLHAGVSYLRVHQKGFGAVGVSNKYGARSFARYRKSCHSQFYQDTILIPDSYLLGLERDWQIAKPRSFRYSSLEPRRRSEPSHHSRPCIRSLTRRPEATSSRMGWS